MAAIHDKAREDRLVQRGGRRYNLRLNARARQVLEQLAQSYDCTHRDVFEGLLLGTIDLKSPRARLIERERLSPAEAAYLELPA